MYTWEHVEVPDLFYLKQCPPLPSRLVRMMKLYSVMMTKLCARPFQSILPSMGTRHILYLDCCEHLCSNHVTRYLFDIWQAHVIFIGWIYSQEFVLLNQLVVCSSSLRNVWLVSHTCWVTLHSNFCSKEKHTSDTWYFPSLEIPKLNPRNYLKMNVLV